MTGNLVRPGRQVGIWGVLFLVCSLFCSIHKAKASHAMAVDLTYECLGGNQYEFTLSFYRDCKGIAAPNSPELHIESQTCGTHAHINLARFGPAVEVSAICSAQLSNTSCNGGTIPGVQKYVYKGRYTLPANCTDWVFSYSECCRNNLITNLSSKNDIYVEATLNNSAVSCNSSPTFTTIPVPYICNGQPYSYNHGVVDANGDSLVYSLVNALEGNNDFVSYSAGYSATYPIFTTTGSVQFDTQTGQMDLTPNGLQVSVVAIQVKEYRHGVLIGTTMRDMQVIVSNCSNLIPYLANGGQANNQTGGMLIGKNLIEVCPGETVTFDVAAQDDNGDQITLTTNVGTSIPGATFTTNVTGSTGTGNFSWTPTGADAGINTFTVTVRDNACQISGEQTYSFTIHVLLGTSAGADRYYCPSGGPLQLKAVGGSTFTWTLLNGSPATGLSCTNCANPLASPAVTTTYVVESNFAGSCSNKDTITVYAVPDFNLTVSPEIKLCNLTDGAPISATPGPDPATAYTYHWTPEGNLSSFSVADPIARPKTTTKYYVTVTSPQGCAKRDSVTVKVKNLIDLKVLPADSVETCDSVQLDVVLIPMGEIFYEPFNHEVDSSNWSTINGGWLSNTCGAFSHDEAYYFDKPGARYLETKTLDVSTGGSISFYVKAGFCDQCTCDKPENDEQDENMYLEYSIDGGATWKLLYKMDADVFSPINNFTNVVLNIPDDAKTATTKFRWQQINHFPDKDVWVLDEIKIKEGLGDYTYKWTPNVRLSNDTIRNPIASPDTTTTYVVHVTDKETGCVYTDTVKVIFKEEFSIIEHQEFTFCPEDTNFKIQAPGPGGTIYTYKWVPPTGLSDPTIPNPTISPTGDITYTVFISNPNSGCYRRGDVFVKVPPLFTVDTGADTSVCYTNSVKLHTTVSLTGDYEYLWRPTANVSDQSSPTPSVRPNTNTDYIVFVKNKNTGCIKSDTIKVSVYPDFTLKTFGDTVLCPYETGVDIHALATPGTNFTYKWTPDAGMADPTLPDQVVHPVSDTVFQVLAHRDNGCWKKDSVQIRLYQAGLNLGVSRDTTINEGDFANLYAWGANRFVWKNGNQEIATVNSISVSPLTKTTYMVYGYDACFADSLSVTVDVIPLEFFIPNLITPNGDGLNDNFRITNFGTKWNLEVYNRWGQLIYQKDKYINEWNGSGQSDGVYYYHITDTKSSDTYKGWVQIVR